MSIANKPRIDGARFIALLLESIIYGMDWVLLFMCLSVLKYRSKESRKAHYRAILMLTIVLFCCITGNWLCSTIQVYKAFVRPRHESYCVAAGGMSRAEQALQDVSDPVNVASAGFFVTTIMLGDSFLIYRLYVIWSYNYWVVIPPVIISIGSLICGVVLIDLLTKAGTPAFAVAPDWSLSLATLTVACNLYSTSMISMRLVSSRGGIRFHPLGIRRKIIEILIQSAALYCATTILWLAFVLTQSPMVYVAVDLTNPIIALNFCLIIIRTHHDQPPDIYVVQSDNPDRIEFSSVMGSSVNTAC